MVLNAIATWPVETTWVARTQAGHDIFSFIGARIP
jgi:hypothetical protein